MGRKRHEFVARQEAWFAYFREKKRALSQSADEEARRLVLAGAGLQVRALPGNALLRGRIAHLRGQMAEERVVRLLNESPDRPTWLLAARRAPPEIDELGVDVVVGTRDLGPLPLQVKSSAARAEAFRRTHRDALSIVGIVIAPIEMADADAWAAVMTELARLRDAATVADAPPSAA